MIARSTAVALPSIPARAGTVVAGCLAFGALVALRAAGLHAGLLYPDGYQYLLMARGIGEHLQPVTTLGPGGESWAPNADATMKPFFPTLVALLGAFGISPLAAARSITVVSAASVPLLTGLIAFRLGAGRPASAIAALLCAASPTLAYWSGYAGPDPVAQALALGAVLALLHRRPHAGGMLGGLSLLTRPTRGLVALSVLLAAAIAPRTRHDALRAAGAGGIATMTLVALLRPGIGLPPAAALGGGALLIALAVTLLLVADRLSPLGATCIALSAILPFALLDGGAWASLARQDWALLALAAAGLGLCLRSPLQRANAIRIVALVLPLATAYWVKNPAMVRYLAQLVPALALLAALGLGTLDRRRLAATTAAAGLVAAAAIGSSQPAIGVDAFQELAPALERAPAGTIVTAAPDAYSVLLPQRRALTMRPGATGLVLVDGAARAYSPDLRAEGAVVRRIPVTTGFLRPDGVVDRRPALLYRGRVVVARR